MRTHRDQDPPDSRAAEKEALQEAQAYIATHPLSACPFCGCLATATSIGNNLHGYWIDWFQISCQNKDCQASHSASTIAGTVSKWNKRVESRYKDALRTIYQLTEGSADGAPDASAYAQSCNEISGLAASALGGIETRKLQNPPPNTHPTPTASP